MAKCGSPEHIEQKRVGGSCQRIAWLLAAYQVALMASDIQMVNECGRLLKERAPFYVTTPSTATRSPSPCEQGEASFGRGAFLYRPFHCAHPAEDVQVSQIWRLACPLRRFPFVRLTVYAVPLPPASRGGGKVYGVAWSPSARWEASHLILRSLCSPTNQVRLLPDKQGKVSFMDDRNTPSTLHLFQIFRKMKKMDIFLFSTFT